MLDFLLAGPLGRDELRAQAETTRVVGVCSCGCPSVTLGVDDRLPRAQFRSEETEFGRTDAVQITAYQPKSRDWTQVTLHVIDGHLNELEIWSGQFGVRPRVDPDKLVRVEDIDWGSTA